MNIESIIKFITGKTKEEREAERQYKKEANKEINQARLEARKENLIKLAKEEEKIKVDSKLKQIKQRYSGNGINVDKAIIFGQGLPQKEIKPYSIITGKPL